MPKYIAVTIGPTDATLNQTRSTRALWTASYMFSYIMREIIRAIKSPTVQLLTPYTDEITLFDNQKKVGLFHDHFIAQVDAPMDLKSLQIHAQTVITSVADSIVNDLQNKNIARGKKKMVFATLHLQTDLKTFFNNYLKLYAVEIETAEENPVPLIEAYLTSLELKQTFVPSQSDDFLSIFFEALFYNFFIQQEFGSQAGFPSTVEIATVGLENINQTSYDKERKLLRKWELDENDDTEEPDKQIMFLNAIKDLTHSQFKSSHKYVAIVKADGDNMGKLFGKLDRKQRLDLSQCLMSFAQAAVKRITECKAAPVYAGGDDLLFFSPIVIENIDTSRQTIFDTIDAIDNVFKTEVLDKMPEGVLKTLKLEMPSMTYGISIGYYKYPLGESLKKATDLMYAAKVGKKDAIHWAIIKHSGQSFGMLFHKKDTTFTQFKNLLNAHLPVKENSERFLNGIIYKLETLEGVFKGIKETEGIDFSEGVHNILFNNFNEDIHRVKNAAGVSELNSFLKAVETLIQVIFSDNQGETAEKNLNKVYSALRFIHFINTEDKND